MLTKKYQMPLFLLHKGKINVVVLKQISQVLKNKYPAGIILPFQYNIKKKKKAAEIQKNRILKMQCKQRKERKKMKKTEKGDKTKDLSEGNEEMKDNINLRNLLQKFCVDVYNFKISLP